MPKFLSGFFVVPVHGCSACAGGVITFQIDTNIFGTTIIDLHGVSGSNGTNKVLGVFMAYGFDTKIVYNQCKFGLPGFVVPEARDAGGSEISKRRKILTRSWCAR